MPGSSGQGDEREYGGGQQPGGCSAAVVAHHVGKLYNLAAMRLARRLHEEFGGYAEAHLVSATGQPLGQPWRTLVRLSEPAPAEGVHALIEEALAGFPALTAELIHDGALLS